MKKMYFGLNKFFELRIHNYLEELRGFYPLFGLISFFYGVLFLYFQAPLYIIISKFFISSLFLVYNFWPKSNLRFEFFIMKLTFIDIFLFSAVTYNIIPITLFWLLMAPSYVLIFKNRITQLSLITFLVLLSLSVPFVNKSLNIEFKQPLPEYGYYLLNMSTFLFILLINVRVINKFMEIKDKDYSKLIKTQQDLINSKTYKEGFFSMVSHEIRTPLNAIVGASRLLEKENIDPIIQNTLNTSSQMLVSLINDFLEYNEIKNGNIKIEKQAFNIREQVKSFHHLFEFQKKENNVNFFIDIDENVPKIVVGDKKRFLQILLNLVGNSFKYTHNGSVFLQINAKIIENIAYLEMLIEDTSEGLNEEEINNLFNVGPQQFEKNMFNHNIHSQLGLSITKKIVEAQNGKILVESKIGKGTTYKVFINYGIENPQIMQILKNPMEAKFGKNDLKIMLVDDNNINLTIAKKQLLLKENHLIITTLSSGKDAVDVSDEELFDVILMDVRMPILSGIEASKIIRQNSKKNKDTPIIAVTADISDQTIEECRNAGMNEIVSKPFNLEELIQAINKFVP